MTAGQKKYSAISILILSLFLSTCKKDITLPNQDIEKIFGTWNWTGSYCGWSGPSSPATLGHSRSITFDKNGICKFYVDNKLEDKRKFSVITGTSIHSSNTAYLMKYEDTGFLKKKRTYLEESITFSGADTLFLDQEAYDACGSSFVKQK